MEVEQANKHLTACTMIDTPDCASPLTDAPTYPRKQNNFEGKLPRTRSQLRNCWMNVRQSQLIKKLHTEEQRQSKHNEHVLVQRSYTAQIIIMNRNMSLAKLETREIKKERGLKVCVFELHFASFISSGC